MEPLYLVLTPYFEDEEPKPVDELEYPISVGITIDQDPDPQVRSFAARAASVEARNLAWKVLAPTVGRGATRSRIMVVLKRDRQVVVLTLHGIATATHPTGLGAETALLTVTEALYWAPFTLRATLTSRANLVIESLSDKVRLVRQSVALFELATLACERCAVPLADRSPCPLKVDGEGATCAAHAEYEYLSCDELLAPSERWMSEDPVPTKAIQAFNACQKVIALRRLCAAYCYAYKNDPANGHSEALCQALTQCTRCQSALERGSCDQSARIPISQFMADLLQEAEQRELWPKKAARRRVLIRLADVSTILDKVRNGPEMLPRPGPVSVSQVFAEPGCSTRMIEYLVSKVTREIGDLEGACNSDSGVWSTETVRRLGVTGSPENGWRATCEAADKNMMPVCTAKQEVESVTFFPARGSLP